MPSGRGQLLGVFYATPANSIRAGADALIAASRGAIVPKPASTAYTGSGYTLTLPGGWTAKKTSSGTPLLSSADGQAVVSVNEQDLAVTPTDVELRKQIADTTSVLGKSLKVTFSVANRPITIGALHVLTGVLTASNHSIGVEVSYLSDGQHLLLILELYPSGTPQADLDQATALIGSIVVTGGGALTTSSPTPTPEATPAGTPAPQTGAGSVYNGNGYSVRLPGGWSVQKLSDGTPVVVSGHGTVIVRISADTLQAALTAGQIRAVIAKVGDDFSKQGKVTYAIAYAPLRVGSLHGVVGTLTAAGKPTIKISGLVIGTQVVNARDLRQVNVAGGS